MYFNVDIRDLNLHMWFALVAHIFLFGMCWSGGLVRFRFYFWQK